MPFNTGAGAVCAIGKESAWGTPIADTMLLNFTSESMAPEVTKTEEESLLAATAAAAYDLMGIKAAGDVSLVLKPENAGFIFKAALGGVDTVTNPTSQYMHTIIPQVANTALPSYTVRVNRKQAIKMYSGCRVNSLKISAKAADYVKATLSFKGKDEATGTITSTLAPSLKAYKFIGATIVAGGTTLEATSIDFSYENNLEDGPMTTASGLYATDPMHAKRKISFTAETPYDANVETLKTTNLLTDTVLSTVVIHLESPSIIALTHKYRVDITLANVAVTAVNINVGGPGILTASISGEATAVGATVPCTAVVYDNVVAAY